VQRSVRSKSGLAAPLSLPAGFAALLVLGAAAALAGGQLPAVAVLAGAAVIVAAACAVAELAAAPLLALAGWLTVIGFSGPPYGQLQPTGTLAVPAIAVIGASALAGVAVGLMVRSSAVGRRLGNVDRPGATWGTRPGGLPGAISTRRLLAGALLLAGLPLLTLALTAARSHFDLTDDLLLYLVVVVAIAIVGGFWPAVAGAIGASLLINWYFTPPLHTLTIDQPRNLLALLLFVTVAVTVSSVVHLAARRAQLRGGCLAARPATDRARRR
jgi:hypothetical protein